MPVPLNLVIRATTNDVARGGEKLNQNCDDISAAQELAVFLFPFRLLSEAARPAGITCCRNVELPEVLNILFTFSDQNGALACDRLDQLGQPVKHFSHVASLPDPAALAVR